MSYGKRNEDQRSVIFDTKAAAAGSVHETILTGEPCGGKSALPASCKQVSVNNPGGCLEKEKRVSDAINATLCKVKTQDKEFEL